MSDYDLREMLLSGRAPKNIRLLMAQGAMPLPVQETLELLVHLSRDDDDDISKQAVKTLDNWNESEVLALLRLRECPAVILDYFADIRRPEHFLYAVVANPSASGEAIARLASDASLALLEAILDNRIRIIEFPSILENIRRNPSAGARVIGLVQEIETEFLGEKRKDYSIDSAEEKEAVSADSRAVPQDAFDFEAEIAKLLVSPPPDMDLSLEGLASEGDSGDFNIAASISSMSVMEKIKYALFGTREVRTLLIRDTNREVTRAVLRSPKLTGNEVEAIAAMRGVSEDVLREIGNSRDWLKSSIIVNNLVKNPKTPPVIAQRLLPRLRPQELTLMARDRSLPEVTRNNVKRAIRQRLDK